jgi:feruloyl esterase
VIARSLPVALALVAVGAFATGQEQCAGLATAAAPLTRITATSTPAPAQSLPAFCQVDGKIDKRVGFVMRLPMTDWNGKFTVTGCGGFCGSLNPDKAGHSNSMNEALKLGYAVLQTDGGHTAPSWSTDWALGDPRALELYAGAWMPLAVDTGRALTAAFYAREPRRTYFTGCSNGGRLGMLAAQRYPALFDGIAAGGAIFDLTGNSGVHGLWLLQTTRDRHGKAVIDQRKLPLLAATVLAQCDALDGVSDGVVADVVNCRPDLSALACVNGEEASCFGAAELAAVRRLYQGASVAGTQLFPGLPPGSEALWSRWVVGTDDQPAWGEMAAEGNLRLTYGIPYSEPFNPHDYVLADELENLERHAALLNAVDPDLSGLERAGNKLFYYHGLADPLILEGRARQYYDEAVAALGKARLDRVARFVMVPGHGHCWELPGQVADDFNPLQVIDRWVETGQPPEEVIARKLDSAQTRKLCPYPRRAVFIGGNPGRAGSYECR